MRIPTWAAAAARSLLRERVSRGYLWTVAIALALVLVDTAARSHLHLSPTEVVLMLLTLPWTPLLWSLFATLGGMNGGATAYGWWGWSLTVLAAVVSAVVNAGLLGWLARLRRRRIPAG
ncbi:SCO4225 family membrane protein [Actinacidiphila acididurans]|uniref:Uncharacterized protein n=1 Tax=Actinacidiphila acididurans TaxID=2784346 RepID=A0ABS2TVT3_9ACTN|nr:hypothetical protein [Actinacidiphila acididurans]MBM9507449.1 hypothetical protein [Actinacidiphila acididurans]